MAISTKKNVENVLLHPKKNSTKKWIAIWTKKISKTSNLTQKKIDQTIFNQKKLTKISNFEQKSDQKGSTELLVFRISALLKKNFQTRFFFQIFGWPFLSKVLNFLEILKLKLLIPKKA